MATKINISIPEPCHENWQNMSVIEKERFCDLCQKKFMILHTPQTEKL